MNPEGDKLLVERVQTGVRLEKRLLKVLKALAELYDLSLGDLLEGIVLHAFEGKSPFSAETLQRIAASRLNFDYRISHDRGAPDRAFDDGTHTYVGWTSRLPGEAPVCRVSRNSRNLDRQRQPT